MSRREERSSSSKNHRSRFDREPSPKRSRRDGKQEIERPPTDTKDRSNRDDRHHHRLRDALPLEAPPAKVENGIVSKETADKTIAQQGGTKHSTDPTKVPRSESFFKHDDRDIVQKNGRGYTPRTDKEERGWWKDPTEQEKAKNGREISDLKPSTHKRPSFSEQKISVDPEKSNKTSVDVVKANPQDRGIEIRRRDERGYSSRHSDRRDMQFSRKEINRADASRSNFSYSDRNNNRNGNNRWSGGGGVEKWKHDLYKEANRSPSPKNQEDQISKIEALLAS